MQMVPCEEEGIVAQAILGPFQLEQRSTDWGIAWSGTGAPLPTHPYLVLRFRGSNHIDASINLVLRSAHVILRRACPTWGARLEGLRASRRTATSETEPAAILRDGASRLLRMRSVGLSSIRPIRLASWNRSTEALSLTLR